MEELSKKPRRAVIYARISLDMVGEGLAVQRQVEICKAAAEREGWTVVAVLEEDPTSASDFTKKPRPQYQAMLAGLKAGRYDGVIAQHSDRLSRRVRELVVLIDLAQGHGVPFLTVEGELDLSTSRGILSAQLGAVLAENESRLKSERHRLSNAQRREVLKRHYGRKIPFGYIKGTGKGMVKDPAMREHLEEAFKSVLAGGSGRDVMRKWQSDEVPTSSGKPWTITSVFQILKNPTYWGGLTYKGKVISEGSDWEPYITEDQFNLVQSVLTTHSSRVQGKRERSPAREYLMSKILLCSCVEDGPKRYMVGHKRKDGALGYICSAKGAGLCSRTMVGEYVNELVTNHVVNTLNSLSPDRVIAPEVLVRRNEISKEVAKIEETQETVRKDRSIEMMDRLTYSRELKESKDLLLSELEELTRANLIGTLVAHVMDWKAGDQLVESASKSSSKVREVYEALGSDQKRTLIDGLGVYRHKPMGKGRRSELEIFPKDPLSGEISMYSTVEDPDH